MKLPAPLYLLSFFATFGVLAPLPLLADTLPETSAESVGLSSERLERINDLIERYMADQQITGAVTMVARHGQIAHVQSQGWMDREEQKPMRRDAIFRMASMTKPVTAVAILMLL